MQSLWSVGTTGGSGMDVFLDVFGIQWFLIIIEFHPKFQENKRSCDDHGTGHALACTCHANQTNQSQLR
jgi:hypothetical protein